jgi:hypothetical protein
MKSSQSEIYRINRRPYLDRSCGAESHFAENQKLFAHRLPKPKQMVRGSVSGAFPSLPEKRSGSNSGGLACIKYSEYGLEFIVMLMT